MSTAAKKGPRNTPPRIHPSIKKDRMNPADYANFDTRFSCEECSHFDSLGELCTIGYVAKHHRKSEQEHQYRLAGNMAFCRFHEID